jgi:hypothetical protein
MLRFGFGGVVGWCFGGSAVAGCSPRAQTWRFDAAKFFFSSVSAWARWCQAWGSCPFAAVSLFTPAPRFAGSCACLGAWLVFAFEQLAGFPWLTDCFGPE